VKVWSVTEAQLRDCAAEVGVELYELREEGRALRFRIVPTAYKDARGDHKYQRVSVSVFREGRRVHAVCWHGHRDFMRAIFRANPDARIKTGIADYRGSDDFEQKFEATGDRNVGSLMYPMRMRDACKCHDDRHVVFYEMDMDGTVAEVAVLRREDMLACPFCIIDPSHYRADGSCRCNDPQEQERMIREWDYTREDFEKVGM